MRVIGYGVCGPGEADKYLEETLKEFERLCDETVILCNNTTKKEEDLIKQYGFHIVKDDREWGTSQNRIKEDLVKNHVAPLKPDWCICLDMDEKFDRHFTKEKLTELEQLSDSLHFYVTNLWDEGWNPKWSFWNIRAWRWKQDMLDQVGDKFFAFEQRPLHCGLAPKWAYMVGGYAPHLLIHSGLKEKSVRDAKVDRYKQYDPNAKYRDRAYYDALEHDTSEPYDEEEAYRQVVEEVGTYKQQPKNLYMRKQEPVLFFRRKKDGVIIDTPKSRSGTMMDSDKFELVHESSNEVKSAPLVKREEPVESGKTRFVYVAHHGQPDVDDTEGHISRALEELGHEVVKVHQESIPNPLPEGDVLLFHKWIPGVDFKGKKVCWYFDKVNFLDREPFMDRVVELADEIFVTDGTWADKVNNPKVHILRQGVGYDCEGGQRGDAPDIAFTGSLYQDRDTWAKRMKEKYGDKFQVFNDKHRQSLNDLCVSAKIMVCPEWPFTDNWWSNRVYNTMGRGGFLLHPRLPGLEKEFEDKKHLVLYDDEEDMHKKIFYYLRQTKKREEIQKAGTELVRAKHTYKLRVKDLCDTILSQM